MQTNSSYYFNKDEFINESLHKSDNSAKGYLYKIKNDKNQTIGYLFGTIHEIDRNALELLDNKIFKKLSRSKVLNLEINRYDENFAIEVRKKELSSSKLSSSNMNEVDLVDGVREALKMLKENPIGVEDVLATKAESQGLKIESLETLESRSLAFSASQNEVEDLNVKLNSFVALLVDQSIYNLQQADKNLTNLDIETAFSHLIEGYGFLAEAIKNFDLNASFFQAGGQNGILLGSIKKLMKKYEEVFEDMKSNPSLDPKLIECLDEGIKTLNTLLAIEVSRKDIALAEVRAKWKKGTKIENLSSLVKDNVIISKYHELINKITFLRDNTIVNQIDARLRQSSETERCFYAIGSQHLIGDYENVIKRLEQKGWKIVDAYKKEEDGDLPEKKVKSLTNLDESLRIFPQQPKKNDVSLAETSRIPKNEDISDRKLHLEQLRLQNPDLYPAYLDELLDHKAIHTFDHLIQMKGLSSRAEVEKEIDQMELSKMVPIILETKQMMVEKVKNSLNTNCENMVLLLGNTGSGKSTTWSCLRGDKMILKEHHYEAETEQNQYISHSRTNSCTFLPNVMVKDNCAIVDCPGFSDSNGSIITLGMELGLKALINEYQPKVLLLEAITNTEGRFANIAKLGQQMSRILANTNDCILGLTKYASQPDYLNLQWLTEEQKKGSNLALLTQKSIIKSQLDILKTIPQSPELLPVIAKLEEDLKKLEENLKKLEENESDIPLKETDEMKSLQASIEEIENEFLNQLKLSNLMRFKELEKPDNLKDCLKKLLEANSVQLNPKPTLDSEHHSLLEKRFKKDVLEKFTLSNISLNNFETLTDLESSVLENGFLDIIIKSSFSDIAPLLQEPEFQSVINRYNKQALSNFIESRIEKPMRSSFIKEINGKLRESQPTLEAFENILTKIKKHILALEGYKDNEIIDEAKMNRVWKEVSQKWLENDDMP